MAAGSATGTSAARPPASQAPRGAAASRWLLALMLAPGALVVFLGFNAGGYFPATPAIAAIALAQLLLVRIMQAERPFEGLAPATLVALLALSAYAALELASAAWSHALGRALVELDRTWMYMLALLLFGSVQATSARLRWLVRGLAGGAAIVCLVALLSRVAPDVWRTAPDVANERLSYPVTYWNALGLLAALAILFAAHLTCSLGERRALRVLGAGLLPLLAATLFFTFSRASIAVCAVGLLLYALLGRPRALLAGALASLPATTLLLVVAYHANLLDTVDPTTPAAVAQGHRVALAAALCAALSAGMRALLAARLDRRAGALMRRPFGRRVRLGALAVLLAAVAVAVPAAGIPAAVARDWDRFASGAQPHGEHGDLRRRLTDPSNNQRTLLWRAALDGYAESPLRGRGAGTFQTVWDRRRPRYIYTVNAHSLYLQALAELGTGGAALLALLVVTVLGGLALRARGRLRSTHGVLAAAGLAWALHAGVDWDWEMPVVTLPFFAAAGVGLSRRGAHPGGWVPGPNARIALGLLCLLTLALPVLLIGSQRRLDQAEHALYASRCPAAIEASLSSIGWLDARPQPYEVLGFCDLQRGFPHLGVEAMRRAVQRDPVGWEPYYGLALAQAAAGVDPRAAAGRALAMNPFEPLVRQAAAALQTSSPTRWVARAALLRASALRSNRLSIAPS
jgi:hypothetical protein